MSEPREEASPPTSAPAAVALANDAAEPARGTDNAEERVPPPGRPDRARTGIVLLAVALVLIVAVVLASPFWAPSLMPLLPWAASAQHQPDLAGRLDRIEAADQQREQRQSALANTAQQLDKRLAALETRPAASPGDIAELRQQIAKTPTVSPNDLAELRQQVAGLPKQIDDLRQQLAKFPNELSDLQQQLGKLSEAQTGLANRTGTIEKAVQAVQAADQTDTALVLALLQMRAAIEAGRPFPAEYQAFATLARDRPDLAGAAAPLAEAAKSGVPTRAVLIQRLGQLAGNIASPPAAANDWQGQTWTRLSSLVTVRRIGGAGQSEPEAAVSQAQRLLAQGDLEPAIAALDKLQGASAEAARPWLAMARTRLAAETALRRIETALTQRLAAASPAGSQGASGAASTTAATPPQTSGARP